ncbi:MAG: hypothetical protein JKY51_10025 [Opitutaceae bacterium]|nr:hypothetical protein [Opitutaceae bacterium]
MGLLNYTTKIDASKSIAEIQKCLQKHGANAILTEFGDEGFIESLSFKIHVHEQDISFRLPCDWKPVAEILRHETKVPIYVRENDELLKDQSLRVAWRVVKDWVEAQMAILEMQMVTVDQVFLPYAVTKDGSTVYEQICSNGFLLDAPKE